MFDFFRRKGSASASIVNGTEQSTDDSGRSSWMRLLHSTRQRLARGFSKLFSLSGTGLNEEGWRELEEQLLDADLSVMVVKQIVTELKKQRPTSVDQAVSCLRETLVDIIKPCERPAIWGENGLETVLVVGVNGVGKTTTIGKLAYYFKQQGRRVMLAAGDTFRAAAVDQLKIWGERNGIPVIAQFGKADSAAVIYDAMQSAQAKGCNLLLADTAGRLHTQHDFMQELSKIKRVMSKFDQYAPHHVILVLDATIGQNALHQVEEFSNSTQITGLCITKLDGTAKGGVIFAIAQRFKLPIYFLGMGENIDQLYPFSATEFVDALLDK